MVLKLIRWFRGYVVFTLYGKAPERFINLCSINGINLWNTMPQKGGLRGCMSVFDYKHIRKYAKKSKARLKIKFRRGLPFFINKYKGRAGLAIGAALFLAITFFLSSFIWSINIVGAEDISERRLMKTLEENGLSSGTYKGNLNVQKIQRDTIIEMPEIGWMSINIQDSAATVEIKEKAGVPQMNDDTYPCSIKARCDGVITGFEITRGKGEIMRGSAVAEGQLLVNSVVEDKMGGVTFTHAKAKVYADIEQTKTFSMPIESYVLMPSEEKTKRCSLCFFGFDIPASFADSDYEFSVKQSKSSFLCSERNNIPLGIREETEIEYKYKTISLSKEQVRAALMKEMALYEVFCKQDSTVVSRGYSGGIAGGNYTLHINYMFNEDIAVEQELYIDN